METDDSDDEIDDPMPFGVRVAVMVWRVYGGLWLVVAGVGLISGLFGFIAIRSYSPCLLLLPFLLVFYFVVRRENAEVCRGHDASFGSMTTLIVVVGILHFIPAILIAIVFRNDRFPIRMQLDLFLAIGAFGTPGFSLLVAGLLALRDAKAYRDWAARRQLREGTEVRSGQG